MAHTVTVTLLDAADTPCPGHAADLALVATPSTGVTISSVTDHGNGTYTATVSSSVEGTIDIDALFEGDQLTATGNDDAVFVDSTPPPTGQSPVSLIAADGELVDEGGISNFVGNGYYERSGFTRAAAWSGPNPIGGTFAGFDHPQFIPIACWHTDFSDPDFYDRMDDLGLNGMLNAWETVDLNDLAPNHKWATVISDQHPGGTITTGQDPHVLGVLSGEEPFDQAGYEAIVADQTTWLATSDGPGRFGFYNYTVHILNNDDGFGPHSTADAVEQADLITCDYYWISGAPDPTHHVYDNMPFYFYTALGTPTESQLKRGSNYGSMMDTIRKHYAEGGNSRKPVGIWVENGAPFSDAATGMITPAQMKWAIWSTIVHGARSITYFNHTFREDEDFSSNNFNDNFYGGPGVPGTGIYQAAKDINYSALVVAPAINGPFDGYLCFGDGLADYTHTGFLVSCTSANPRNYYSGVDASCRWVPTEEKHYIFATTREAAGTTGWVTTFRMVDQGQTFAVRLYDTGGTLTISRGGSIPAGFCEFTDSFATAESYKCYRID